MPLYFCSLVSAQTMAQLPDITDLVAGLYKAAADAAEWAEVWQAVAESRNIDAGALDGLADRAPLLRDDAVESGLVDRIGFRDEAFARIAELVGVKDVSDEIYEDAAPRLYLSRYAGATRSRLAPPVPSIPGRRSKPTIAVVN